MIERRILGGSFLLAAFLLAAGCASPAAIAFDSRFPDNSPERTAAVVASLPPPSSPVVPDNALGRPLIAAVSYGKDPGLIVHDIGSGATLWRRALRAERRPQLLGDLLVTATGRELMAFALATGEPAWRAPVQGEVYLGAARWRQIVVYACGDVAFGSGRSRSRVTALDAQTGRRLWQHTVDGRVGKPEAAGAMFFVPWDLQNLTVLDARTGREVARLRATDDVIKWVKAGAGGVFFGHDTIYRLGERGYGGTDEGVPRLLPRLPEMPWLSSLRESAYTFKPAKRSAEGRIGLLFEPLAHGDASIRVSDDRFYLLFFRYVFAFDADGKLIWSRLLDSEAIAGQPVTGGLLAVMESGQTELLAASDGRTLVRRSLPEPLASAEIDVEGVAADRRGHGRRREAAAARLRNELVRIALDPDNRLLAARVFAVEQLAGLVDPGVTRDLLDIYEQDPLPKPLKEAVAAALSGRSSGTEHMLDALGRHHDFLLGTRAPPLTVLVPALVGAGEKRAVPLLVAHLFEPETPLEVLPDLVSAIDVLGDDMVAAPLFDFLSRYRADSAFTGSPEALELAALAVLRRGDSLHRDRLRSISTRSDTHEPLARTIALELRRERGRETTDGATAARAESKAIPERIDQRTIDAVFARHVDAIRVCITEELARNPELARVRIAFVLEREGRARELKFSPPSPGLVECLAPGIKRYRFPRIGAARQLASYTVTLRARAEKTREADGIPQRSSSSEQKRWWAYAIRRETTDEEGATDPGRRPWWFSALRVAENAGRSAEKQAAESPETSPGPRSKKAAEPERSDATASPEETNSTDWWVPVAP